MSGGPAVQRGGLLVRARTSHDVQQIGHVLQVLEEACVVGSADDPSAHEAKAFSRIWSGILKVIVRRERPSRSATAAPNLANSRGRAHPLAKKEPALMDRHQGGPARYPVGGRRVTGQ